MCLYLSLVGGEVFFRLSVADKVGYLPPSEGRLGRDVRASATSRQRRETVNGCSVGDGVLERSPPLNGCSRCTAPSLKPFQPDLHQELFIWIWRRPDLSVTRRGRSGTNTWNCHSVAHDRVVVLCL